MAFTNSLCPQCLRALHSQPVQPAVESLVLLGVDHVAGDGVPVVKSRHYACVHCMATWKATPERDRHGESQRPPLWELIDAPD